MQVPHRQGFRSTGLEEEGAGKGVGGRRLAFPLQQVTFSLGNTRAGRDLAVMGSTPLVTTRGQWGLGTCPGSPGKAVVQLGAMMMKKTWRPAQRIEWISHMALDPSCLRWVHKRDLNPGNPLFCPLGGRGLTTSEATPVAARQGRSRGCALLGGGAIPHLRLGTNAGQWDTKSRHFLLGDTPP